MIWGLDAAYPPQDAAAAAYYRTLGWQFFCGYIGGRALNVWSQADWNIAYDAGFQLLPIWVAPKGNDASEELGVDEGNQALVELQALGLSGVVVLDVEDGATPANYVRGFSDALHAGSCSLALYGTPATVDVLGLPAQVDLIWLAMWPQSPLLLGPAPIGPDIWQYASGAAVDFNCARDDFPWAQLSR